MPPTDASTDAGTAPRTDARSRTSPGADSEDTLDLRLPDEFLALFAERTGAAGTLEGAGDAGATTERSERSGGEPGPWAGGSGRCETRHTAAAPAGDDLLDRVGDWGPTATAAGVFQLVPVHIDRDLPLIGRWMDDPAVAAFWELSGPGTATEDHLRAQLGGDGRSVPCLGMLDGTPMSYWEIYRADLDPLARHYPARLHDTGIHLLIGGVTNRGRGLGTILLRAVSDLVLDRRPSCARVVAEPDLRNTPSVSAFLSAGFRFSAEVDLPDKKAALMVRDRALRDLL
ncbi:GNAT family N-acetyltransferase [Streptomyces sp. NPDC020802]|uniref:GNAT family N-acetyltransferase n=1 Tax=Streptomyces sp. NPDC020802 TaxID=3365094 RepID=UPI0037B5509E